MDYANYIRKALSAFVITATAYACQASADVDPVAYVREELARGNSRIVIPKGVYEIEPDGSKETVYFRLSGLRDVTIDFSGSKLVGKVATRLFHVEGCTNLVADAAVTDRPTFRVNGSGDGAKGGPRP